MHSERELTLVDEFHITTDSADYRERPYKDEQELEQLVVAHAEEVFGKDTLYFGTKQKVASRLHTRIPDGLLLDFRTKPAPHLWVVEYELGSHNLEKHVIPQLRGFVKAFDNETTITTLRASMYDEINSNEKKRKKFKDLAGEKSEVYFTLDKALHASPTILLVFDRVPENIDAVFEEADFDYNMYLMEFRTFQNDGKRVHLFNPLIMGKGATGPKRVFKWVEGKHWTQSALKVEVLKLLAQRKSPLGRKEIISILRKRLTLSPADKEMLGSRTRWEKTARFAITSLSLDKSIRALDKNQWVITAKGSRLVNS